jgi:hypothetical protein
MNEIFPEPISKLPQADMPFEGVKAYLSQLVRKVFLIKKAIGSIYLPGLNILAKYMRAMQILLLLTRLIDMLFIRLFWKVASG